MSLLPKFLHEAIAKMMNTMFDNEGSDLKYEINPDAAYGTNVGVDRASGKDVGVSVEMVMVEASYLEHAGKMLEEHGRLKGFWNELASYMFEHWDMDGGEFQDLGVKFGLLTLVEFDPEVHFSYEAEPGDPFYINTLQEDTSETTNDDAGDDGASPTG